MKWGEKEMLVNFHQSCARFLSGIHGKQTGGKNPHLVLGCQLAEAAHTSRTEVRGPGQSEGPRLAALWFGGKQMAEAQKIEKKIAQMWLTQSALFPFLFGELSTERHRRHLCREKEIMKSLIICAALCSVFNNNSFQK